MSNDIALAAEAKIPVPVLRAIRSVESSGAANLVRFEPHLFNRFTQNRFQSQIPFTPDPQRGVSLQRSETDRQAFERAARLDRNAAIRATSWGRYQVLGSHLLRLYPNNPVEAFDSAPSAVSDALLISWFTRSPRAQQAAAACDTEELAYRYNGSRTSPWRARFERALANEGGCTPEGGSSWTWLWLLLFMGAAGYAGVRFARRKRR